MAEKDQNKTAFIAYLEELHTSGNRGALAQLRKGLGKKPGTVMEMYPYIVPWIKDDTYPWDEYVRYIVASLFASHPKSDGHGNLGMALRKVKNTTGSESIEARFVTLLDAHPDDLHNHLRHAVSLSQSKDIPIYWNQLFLDLLAWNHPQRYVQKNWAKSFWGGNENKDEDKKQDE